MCWELNAGASKTQTSEGLTEGEQVWHPQIRT